MTYHRARTLRRHCAWQPARRSCVRWRRLRTRKDRACVCSRRAEYLGRQSSIHGVQRKRIDATKGAGAHKRPDPSRCITFALSEVCVITRAVPALCGLALRLFADRRALARADVAHRLCLPVGHALIHLVEGGSHIPKKNRTSSSKVTLSFYGTTRMNSIRPRQWWPRLARFADSRCSAAADPRTFFRIIALSTRQCARRTYLGSRGFGCCPPQPKENGFASRIR